MLKSPSSSWIFLDPALLDPHCDTCSRKFYSKQLKAAYQYHKKGCLKAVHRQPACSRFRKLKGTKEQADWLLKVWLCKKHNPTAQTNANKRPLALLPLPPVWEIWKLQGSLWQRHWQLNLNAPSAAKLSDPIPTLSGVINVAGFSTLYAA